MMQEKRNLIKNRFTEFAMPGVFWIMRFFATALLFAAFALSAQDAPKQDAPKKGGGRAPRNLKILPADQNLLSTMRSYTVALGKQCNFCHVQGDNASDDKHEKIVARKMIEMVNHINETLGADAKVKVTCY